MRNRSPTPTPPSYMQPIPYPNFYRAPPVYGPSIQQVQQEMIADLREQVRALKKELDYERKRSRKRSRSRSRSPDIDHHVVLVTGLLTHTSYSHVKTREPHYQRLKRIFSDYGYIDHIYIVCAYGTDEPTGQAFVRFDRHRDQSRCTKDTKRLQKYHSIHASIPEWNDIPKHVKHHLFPFKKR